VFIGASQYASGKVCSGFTQMAAAFPTATRRGTTEFSGQGAAGIDCVVVAAVPAVPTTREGMTARSIRRTLTLRVSLVGVPRSMAGYRRVLCASHTLVGTHSLAALRGLERHFEPSRVLRSRAEKRRAQARNA
jgi:hypothetical protein